MGRGGREWSDIAVLVRKKKDARLITDSLKQLGIPVDEVGARDYFRQPVIRAAVAYLRVMDDPERNQTALGHVMMRPVHGIMPGELARFTRYARDRGDADEEGRTLWAALGDIDGFDGEAGAFCSLKEELDRLFRVKGEEGLEPLVRAVLFGRDLFRVEIEKGDVDNTRLLTRLMSLTGEFASVYTDANLSEWST
jgi:superfamily I DNA/RNA helicase